MVIFVQRAALFELGLVILMGLPNATSVQQEMDALYGPFKSAAYSCALFPVIQMPDSWTGLSPSDVFTKIRWEQRKMAEIHVWGCPVYVLDKMISDGKKLLRWTHCSTCTVNLGFSDKQARSVPFILNPHTGYIIPQIHILFDRFATVPASNDDSWLQLFKDSTYQHVIDHHDDNDNDNDKERLIAESTDYKQAKGLLSQMQ